MGGQVVGGANLVTRKKASSTGPEESIHRNPRPQVVEEPSKAGAGAAKSLRAQHQERSQDFHVLAHSDISNSSVLQALSFLLRTETE